MAETWTHTEDGRSATVSGREPKSIVRRLPLFTLLGAIGSAIAWVFGAVPLWSVGLALLVTLVLLLVTGGFKNDEEPEPPAWYTFGRLAWYFRNPLQNAGKYTFGVYANNYTVVGTAPVTVTAWNDIGDRKGFKTSVIKLGILRLPFVSYVGKRVMWYAGWQWWGFFGFKWNILDSKVQGF